MTSMDRVAMTLAASTTSHSPSPPWPKRLLCVAGTQPGHRMRFYSHTSVVPNQVGGVAAPPCPLGKIRT
jgi:hypothetical protein